jgi:hypothetical protein
LRGSAILRPEDIPSKTGMTPGRKSVGASDLENQLRNLEKQAAEGKIADGYKTIDTKKSSSSRKSTMK